MNLVGKRGVEDETRERNGEERGPGGRGDWGAWGGSGGQNQPGQGDFEPGMGEGAKQRERRRSEKTLNSGSSGSVAYPCGALSEAEGSKLGPS